MRKILFIFLLICCANISFAQHSYYVQFKDKNGTEFSLKYPQKFLSQKAIQRRANQNIALDSTDLPVSKAYLNLLKNQGAQILLTTKWLNGATILADNLQAENIANLPFVDFVQLTKRAVSSENQEDERNRISEIAPQARNDDEDEEIIVTNSIPQHKMLGLDSLHAAGFRGKGVLIAVLDAGFPKVDSISAFDYIRSRIFDTYNFVENHGFVYKALNHGTNVLSIIGANLPDFIGSAPDASFLLYLTEDNTSETLRETDNWVAAAERADSIGADILTASLGYSVFDNGMGNFAYSDLDGKTTRISRAAALAAQKGILVLSAAGNEGNKSWLYILAPADAENIIAVGSIDSLQNRSSFSSIGMNWNDAVKPTICAQGTQTTLINLDNQIVKGNGTSFATPVAAGMAASVWGAFPNLTNFELIEKIVQSASNYANPDNLCGYGVPNVWRIYQKLKEKKTFAKNEVYFAQIKFNSLFIQSAQENDYQFYLCDILGRKIVAGKANGNATVYLPALLKGIYILRITDKTIVEPQVFKLIL